jgi:small conductance mechanosensitive channel
MSPPSDLALVEPQWLDQHWEVLVIRPLRILLIVVLALVVRALVNRAVRRLTRAAKGSTPALLRPLRERALPGLLDDSVLLSERRKQRAETISSILRSIASFTVFSLAVVLVLGEIGINLAPIIASAGIVGVALGFGAQNLVKDFLAGVFMILEDQYGVGDVIDVGEATGTVESVGLRTARLRDVHGTVWYVRNGEIIRVGNKSMWRDPEWSGSVLDVPQYLGVEQITTDGVLVRLTGKVRPGEQWRVGRELRRRLKELFDAEDLGATYTSAQIYVRTDQAHAT